MTVEVPEYDVLSELELNSDEYAFLVVDMQKDFTRPDGALYNPEAEETIEDMAECLQRARGAGVPVWYTRDTHYEDDPEFEIWGEHCRKGTWGWEIVDPLKPREEDLVFEKSRYDGFYGTDLDQQLRVRGKDGLIIAGTVANVCVHYTAASAGLRFLDVVHPVDLISALNEFDYHAALRQASWLFQARLVEGDGLTFR